MQVRVRLGVGLARLVESPLLAVELPTHATVADLLERVGDEHSELAPALRSALPVVAGEHAERERTLGEGEEVALLLPVAGG